MNFALPRALPGDPIAALSDPRSTTYVSERATRADVNDYYGLGRPLLSQYGDYLSRLGRGDLGTSIEYHVPVSEVIGRRLPWTLLLIACGLGLATLAGTLAGMHAGWRRGRRADRGLLVALLTVDSFPVFFVASAAAYLLGAQLGWLPLFGARTPLRGSWGALHQAADIADHLVLPASVLALQFVTYQFLVTRASMVGQLDADYLVLGRAKGMTERTLKYRYAARNAMLPAVTVAGLQLGFAVTAAIFVEAVFAYPGIGRLMFEAVGQRDYPVMQGCFLILTVLVVGANLLVDLLYRRLDPRTAA